MANDKTPTLAMPVGLPMEGVDPEAFYADLAPRLAAEVSAGGVVSVWTDPADAYSGVHGMIRAAASYAKAGSPGLDGVTPVVSATLFLRTWIWEYMSLGAAAGGSSVALPSVIGISNLDEAGVLADVTAELGANPAYADYTADQRTEAVDGFMEGMALLLTNAGSRLGRGQVDASRADGYRRVDVALYDSSGTILQPPFQFSLWSAVGGTWVDGHPLVELVQGPFEPAMSPIEGGIRVKFTGSGLSDAAAINFGGAAPTSVRASSDGKSLYATVPAGSGIVDVVVNGTTYASAFAYVEDVLSTARASLASHAISAAEIAQRAADLEAGGALDDEARAELGFELMRAGLTAGEVIEARSRLSGAAALDEVVGVLLEDAQPDLADLISSALAAIG